MLQAVATVALTEGKQILWVVSGGLPQPGPIFQALPEPLPLPPLPQPERPAEAMSPGMAPETAPAGLPQPGTSFQVNAYLFLSC